MDTKNAEKIVNFLGLEPEMVQNGVKMWMFRFPQGKVKYYSLLQMECRLNNCWDLVMFFVNAVGDKTGYDLVIEPQESYWVQDGEYPLADNGGGYSHPDNVRDQILRLIDKITA